MLRTESPRNTSNHSQEDLVGHRPELDEVLRTESPRITSVQQGLKHLGLQLADFQTEPGRAVFTWYWGRTVRNMRT